MTTDTSRHSGINSRYGSRLLWMLLVAACIVILDQITKAFAVSALTYAVPHTVFPGFDLLLVHNPGAAFSFFSQAGGMQRWALAGIALIAACGVAGALLTSYESRVLRQVPVKPLQT